MVVRPASAVLEVRMCYSLSSFLLWHRWGIPWGEGGDPGPESMYVRMYVCMYTHAHVMYACTHACKNRFVRAGIMSTAPADQPKQGLFLPPGAQAASIGVFQVTSKTYCKALCVMASP